MIDGKRVLVVKLGTSTLTDETGRIDSAYMNNLAKQIAEIRQQGWLTIIVTSAGIAAGLEVLGETERPTDTPSLQAAASVGCVALSQAYAQAFAPYGMVVSSVLLTRRDTASRPVYLHARDTLERLLDWGVVPIVNENDTISIEQIRFGDNDTLSALVACLVQADEAIIFSDVDGLYDKNPSTHDDAVLLPMVNCIDESIMGGAEGPGSKLASGGMITKIRAARVLMSAGIPLTICNGQTENALPRFVSGERIGTRFAREGVAHEITPKKLWIALGDSSHGVLKVDDGCKRALMNRGSSLLSVGVLNVDGDFIAGDVVDIVDANDHLFARGRIDFSSDETRLAQGRSNVTLQSNSLLAHMAERPLVHRDELILFD